MKKFLLLFSFKLVALVAFSNITTHQSSSILKLLLKNKLGVKVKISQHKFVNYSDLHFQNSVMPVSIMDLENAKLMSSTFYNPNICTSKKSTENGLVELSIEDKAKIEKNLVQ